MCNSAYVFDCLPAAQTANFQVRIRLQQQDTLRDLALSSMERFLDFVAAACPANAVVRSTSTVELGDSCADQQQHQRRQQLEEQPLQQPQGRRGVPLLSTEIVLVPDGARLAYGTAPEAIRDHTLALFDRGLQRLQVRASQLCPAATPCHLMQPWCDLQWLYRVKSWRTRCCLGPQPF